MARRTLAYYTSLDRFGNRPILSKADVRDALGKLPRKDFRFSPDGPLWWPVFREAQS